MPLLDLVGAAGVARVGAGPAARAPPPPTTTTTLLLDPTGAEAATSAGGGTALVALMPTRDVVTQAAVGGGWGADELEAATGLAAAGAAGLVGAMRAVLRGEA